MDETERLIDVTLDEAGLPAPTPEMDQERRVAIFDLLEQNRFSLFDRKAGHPDQGPYRLRLSAQDNSILLDVSTEAGEHLDAHVLPLTGLAQTLRDYLDICESYGDAVKGRSPAQIETSDAARRGIHDEGARDLMRRLEDAIEVDMETARRLFSLIAVLLPDRHSARRTP